MPDIDLGLLLTPGSAWMQSAACGNVKIITLLEGAGGKVDVRNAAGMTPLAYAAGQGNVKALHTLINRGANVHTRNKDGTTPLHQAASSGNQVRCCHHSHCCGC